MLRLSLLTFLALASLVPAEPDVAAWRLLSPPWKGKQVWAEGSVLLKKSPDAAPEARLARKASKILAVRSAKPGEVFQEGKDFTVAEDGRTLKFNNPGKIEPISVSDFFVPKGAPNGYQYRKDQPEVFMMYHPGHWYHDRQLEVDYETEEPWEGVVPALADTALPKSFAKLKAKGTLILGVSGDSISTGADASGVGNVAPHQPGYAEMVAAQLRVTTGANVILKNRAVGGWGIDNGHADLDELVKEKPDLIILAYGMNDIGRRSPEWFRGNVALWLQRAREAMPEAEFILVSTMLGNAEWQHTPREMFGPYRDALKSLLGPGIALADLTALTETWLKHKDFHDITGNGLNHPNDSLYRLYAQAVLALLVPPLK
jgi:acyl-CoA thioesterase I